MTHAICPNQVTALFLADCLAWCHFQSHTNLRFLYFYLYFLNCSFSFVSDCPIEPRACGLEIGHTGTQANSTQFFQGDLARVGKVYLLYKYEKCSSS